MSAVGAEVVEGILFSPAIDETALGDFIAWLILASSWRDSVQLVDYLGARCCIASPMFLGQLDQQVGAFHDHTATRVLCRQLAEVSQKFRFIERVFDPVAAGQSALPASS